MKKSKRKTGIKFGRDFTLEEREMIVQEFISGDKTKREVWEKYTGQKEEHGQILNWMRSFGINKSNKTIGLNNNTFNLKSGKEFSTSERIFIIEEYLNSGKTKQEIWKKYTGQTIESGQLLKWMRELDYLNTDVKSSNFGRNKNQAMAKSKEQYYKENHELKDKIKQLEKALIYSELRSTVLDTMIEVAEKELKISISKKSFTQRSTK